MVISATLFLSSLTLLLAVANALLVSSSHSSATSINKRIHYQLGNRIRIRGGNHNNNNNNNNGVRNRNANNNKNPSSLLSQQHHHHQHQHQHGMITDSTATDAATDSDADSSQSHVLNVFSKKEEEVSFIKKVLRANFLFQDFTSIHDEDKKGNVIEIPSLSTVVQSFEKYTYKKGTILCTQGDSTDTDYLYLIASGSCNVSIDNKKLPDPYGTMGEGSLIGDLAMLYGTARAATVRCQTEVTVYRLHRIDFYHFLDHSSTSSSNTDVYVDNDIDHDTVSARQKEIQTQVKEIDEVIDQISGVKSKYDGNIIRQFQPERSWLWRRWRGTILQHAWKSAAVNMLVGLLFLTGLRIANNHIFNNPITWPVGECQYRILYDRFSTCSTSRWYTQ
jgi:CRP-like cAMP-binding protein